jgi:hypothetical protein
MHADSSEIGLSLPVGCCRWVTPQEKMQPIQRQSNSQRRAPVCKLPKIAENQVLGVETAAASYGPLG